MPRAYRGEKQVRRAGLSRKSRFQDICYPSRACCGVIDLRAFGSERPSGRLDFVPTISRGGLIGNSETNLEAKG